MFFPLAAGDAILQAVGFYTTSCLAEEETPLKNRVVGSGAFSSDRAGKSASQTPESHQEITITLTIFVPDRQSFWSMDSFQGFRHDPHTLHKYLYAEADPVNGMDPSGQITLPEMAIVSAISGAYAVQAGRRVSPLLIGTGELPTVLEGREYQAQIRAVGLGSAAAAEMLRELAENVAQTQSGTTLAPGWTDDEVDAFRHCYWSCTMTQSPVIGVKKAQLIADIHEMYKPGVGTPMDNFNNYVGRSIASADPGCNCELECLYGVWQGRLQTHP